MFFRINLNEQPLLFLSPGVCHGCKEKKYNLAPNTYQIQYQVDLCKNTSFRNQIFVSQSGLRLNGIVADISTKKQSKSRRTCLELIKLIEDFNANKGDNMNPKGMLSENPTLFFNMFKAVYNDALELLEKEPKCTMIRPPSFVIGDIHGNIEDLLTMKTAIWSRLELIGSKLVFLGDYVDRGKWSVECALYVLAMKVLMPNKVCLLRGNHEVREIQNKYSFRKECLSKYGDRIGKDLWDMLNLLFDRLPIASVIDDSIYCAHGGLFVCLLFNIDSIFQYLDCLQAFHFR